MQEHAIAIARVSSLSQREEDQRPGLVKFAEDQGYQLDAVIPIPGKSAFHGKHVKAVLAAVNEHVTHGQASVVIFRHVDRSSRQGVFEGYKLITQIMDAGARVEFSAPDQRFLNSQPELLGLYFKMGQAESEIKRERKLQGNAARAARGEVNGRPAWGYDFKSVNNLQILVPNDLGRKWIPAIFSAAVEGKSLRSIQTMLKGIPSPQGNGLWDEASIRRLIASPTYHGGRVGKGNMDYERLVTVEQWQQANAAVAGRARNGRSTVKRDPALVRPICGACYGIEREGAPKGVSPMYRKSKSGHDYYACTGQGTARKSCGAKMAPCDRVDNLVNGIMATQTRPHYELVWIGGDDNAQQLAGINEKIATAAREGHYDLISELSAQAAEISAKPVRKAYTEKRPTGLTVGQHWSTLDLAGKRDELARWEVVVSPEPPLGVTVAQKEPDGSW